MKLRSTLFYKSFLTNSYQITRALVVIVINICTEALNYSILNRAGEEGGEGEGRVEGGGKRGIQRGPEILGTF